MGKPPTADWYRDWFDEDYLTLYAHRDEGEAARFVDVLWSALKLQPGSRVADVPCGPGRHSKALAERGARVAGVDLSEIMIERARETCRGIEPQPEFQIGDIRNLPLSDDFDLVVNLFTSFGYFERESDNEQAFSELSRLLKIGGTLVMDVVNRERLQRSLDPHAERRIDDLDVVETRALTDDGKRVTKHIQLRRGDKTREIHESVRLYSRSELETLAETNGLTPFDCWGDYQGNAFTPDSPRLILLARKHS